jgi:outer membrane protein assembly factor BamB
MSEVARIGGPVGCLGLALLLVAHRRDLRIAGLVAWGLGLAALGAYLAPSMGVVKLGAAGVAGAIGAGVGAWILLRRPWLLAFATLACIPARIPVKLGSEQANLLIPLYGVIGVFAVALGWQLVRSDTRTRELGPLAIPLASFVAWTGLTLLWTTDLRKGAIFLGAFVLPFGLLSLGFARLPWRGRWLTWMWAGLVGTALVYAAVGGYQWLTRDIFWNPVVIVGNAYAPFFRVNSVFWDPSIYGRYLALAIIASLTGILLGGLRRWKALGLTAVIAVTWCGLLLSFSQSSFFALAAGIALAAAVAWGWRTAAGLAVLGLVVTALALTATSVRHELVGKSRSGVNAVTSGRANLVSQGARIALHNPVGGVGVGGFKRAYADRTGLRGVDPKHAASHTTPITVAAEEGLVGLALLVWLVVAALLATLRGLGRGFTSRVSLAVGAGLFVITVHSLFYNDFFEDPVMWALLGLVALVVRVPRKGPVQAEPSTAADPSERGWVTRRRVLLALVALVALGVLGAAAAVVWQRHQPHNVAGSASTEFVTTAAPGVKPRPPVVIRTEPWPTYGLDAQRTRLASQFTLRPPFRVAWTFRGGGLIEFPPAVAYGLLFVPVEKGELVAVSATSGRVVWRRGYAACIAASPAVADGVLYETMMNPCDQPHTGRPGLVVALDARTGRELWRFRPGASESSPLVSHGLVYFGSRDDNVYALDARTGHVRWTYRTGGEVKGGAALLDGVLYIGSYDGHLYALDAARGTLRWRASVESRIGGSGTFYANPALAYGRAFIGATDGVVYAYGLTHGDLLWARRTGRYVYSSAALLRQTVYVGSYDRNFYALDAATGAVRWSFAANGPISGSPTVLGGLVYFSTLVGRTYALDTRTGALVWSFPDGQYSPLVADGKQAYLVGHARVYALVPRR